MKITRLKINGMQHPMGYRFRSVKVSWNVEEAAGKYQKEACIQVALDPAFTQIVCEKTGADLKQYCEELDLALTPRTTYYCRVRVTDETGDSSVSDPAVFETGKMDEPWTGQWICTEPEDTFHPIFAKTFSAEGQITKARLYVCGLGVYEAWMNGSKIGDEYLAPFFNDYACDVQAQTYDITEAVQENNRLELYLGNGWYKGLFGLVLRENLYGSYMTAIAEVHLTYADGHETVIGTDASWTYRGSDVETSGIYSGEVLNRLFWEGRDNAEKPARLTFDVYPQDTEKYHLCDRFSTPLRVTQTLPVKEIITTPAGETVLDMGQNFAGFVGFRSRLPKGTTVTLQYGETLQQGNFFNDNYREATGGLVYTSDGREEDVRVHFTFFGGRYVRVTGWPESVVLDPADFTGYVLHSDLERTGFLETSDPDVNRLILNCLWGQRSNFIDVPTDCPQRSERLGWTGDAQVFSPTASYNMDTRAFFDKYLYDLRIAQLQLDGAVPHVAPMCGTNEGGSSVWADVATFLPATLYEYYGDPEILRTYYPLMKDWVDWITRGDEARGATHMFDFFFTFGDWLALDGMTETSFKGSTDDTYVSTCYYYASAMKVADAAAVLGFEDDATKYAGLAREIKEAIQKEYFTGSGRLAIDSQTAYMIALKFGLYTNKEILQQGLAKRFEKDLHKIKGGFVGATMMCRVLAENGFEEEAWYQLFNHDFPGWLHCVDLGATTIWERWNSLLDDGSISGTGMNSLNHYSYGSVLEFLYRDAAGIAPAAPGFAKVAFAPEVNWRTKYLNGTYKSVSGTWVSNWVINEDGTVTMHFEVPFNCTATAKLPWYDGEILNLEPGITEVTYQPVKDVRAKYGEQTRLAQLSKDPEAMAVLKNISPRLYGMAANAAVDVENGNMTLDTLRYMSFMHIDPAEVEAVIAAVGKIK